MANASKDIATLLGEKLGPVRSNIVFFFQRSRDDWYWKQILENFKRKRLVKAQKINAQDHLDQGSDLAAAKFVISRCGGRVQDERGIWLNRARDLPPKYIKSFKVIAIDASGAKLMTEGTDNFADLEHLKSLNLSRNRYLDDFACDQLARQFRKSSTLETIDLSYNERISVHGLNVLFRIPSLKEIRAINTGATQHQSIDLFTIAAEEERNCKVFAHEDRQFLCDELEEIRKSDCQLPQLVSGAET